MLPLQKAVLPHPERLHPGLGHPFVESRPRKAALLLDRGHRVAVEGGGIGHGDGMSVDVSGSPREMSLDICGRLP
jgi:hypothetical protein